MSEAAPALLADVGGTNLRFALLAADGAIGAICSRRNRDFAGLADAARAYLDEVRPSPAPRAAAICFACPVQGDRVVLTNYGWEISLSELGRSLGIGTMRAINDLAAVALAVPRLGPGDVAAIGGGKAVPDAPVGVIGPGTGLGVASLIETRNGFQALPGEGGHVTMPAADEAEAAVLERLRRRFGHVSAERVLSGPGLANLYGALGEMRGAGWREATAEEVSARAAGDALAGDAARLFSAMLGTVAGDLALTLGAQGGIYLSGGVVAAMGAAFDRAAFRRRFEAKGRMSAYLAAVPTFQILHAEPAFLGLASLVA